MTTRLLCCLLLTVAALPVWADDAVVAPVPGGGQSPPYLDGEPVVAPVPLKRLTAGELDGLIAAERSAAGRTRLISDERFLRRVTLDLIGRQPSGMEVDAFLADTSADKREKLVDRLLDSKEFGRNWADYWSDAVSYHVPQPELTFLNYDLFKQWIADELNANRPWDEITAQILTAKGKVKDNPPATFVGFHEANPIRLASETTRIFLGIQIQCAECHDHPYDDWKREQFHQMAAFYVRTSAKLPHNHSQEIIVSSKAKGEHRMPNAADPRQQGKEMVPAFLTGSTVETGIPDDVRRKQLAEFVTSVNNPWFAESYVNRIWARLMGVGFCEPVDNIGENQLHTLEETHAALANEFRASGYDIKDLFRLVLRTRTYQQEPVPTAEDNVTSSPVLKLRGDEVFYSLKEAIGLPNVRPPTPKKTAAVRFPVPPKSTQEMIAATFGYDPSRSTESVMRTMSQALLMMNNKQLHAQINADPDSKTALSKLLASEKNDKAAFEKLMRTVLARRPTKTEVEIAAAHLESVNDRQAGFEDLLWSLLNSTEFTTRR